MAQNTAPITSPVMTTPQDAHQQAAGQIQKDLKDVFGVDHNVMPTTDETPVPGDNLQEAADRIIWNRPGYEPSGSFLKKLIQRIKKKNPGSQIVYKEGGKK